MANTGCPETVVRGQRPQTLPSNRDNNDKEEDEEYLGLEGYNEEEYEDIEDNSMRAETPTQDLQIIMVSIQALASTCAVLQLASGVKQVGRQT